MSEDNGLAPETANTTTRAGRPSRAKASTAQSQVVISAHFKMIWITITSLTLLLLFADIAMSLLVKHPTNSAQQAIGMCDTFAKVGFGVIFGMLGTKALG
jgi:hypothetical protein